MAVHIRLARMARKRLRFSASSLPIIATRVMAVTSKICGTFHPANQGVLNLDRSRLEYWHRRALSRRTHSASS